MDQIEKHTWEPLKKSHPIFNSLVLKCIISLGVTIYCMVSLSDYSFSYLYGDDSVLMVGSALLLILVILVLLSVAEALIMTAVSIVQWFIVRLRRVLEMK